MIPFALGLLLGGVPGGVLVWAVTVALRLRRRPRPRPAPSTVEVAARLLVLVGAGMSISAALAVAGEGMEEVEAALRRARRLGLGAALAAASGSLGPLLRRLGEAAGSGSPPEPAIRAFIEIERRRHLTDRVERARRLPVRLMVPTALLVLPGFVLMVYGPALLSAVGDLLGPLGR